jgi:hypothetical protein
MKSAPIYLATAVAALAASSAFARSREWYVANPSEAKATYERCLARVRAGEALTAADKEECRRASTAVVHATTFVPSKPVSY